MLTLRTPLRAAVLLCFLAALAAPAALQAQRGSRRADAGLPDAPSATLPMVNGRPYRQPTAKENLKAYEHELIGPRPFISAAIRAGIEQGRDVPTGWGQDFPGYAQRYGSAYAEFAIDSSVRFGLAAVLHEDTRYLICHHCSFGAKFDNAVLAEVTNRHGAEGKREFSVVPIIADFSGPLVAYSAWYPPGYGAGDAARHAFLGLAFHVVGHVVRETLFDRDTKAEKAAAQRP
jgi:hypothetical protein